MFSYYGTKARLAPHYPAPKFDTVIEPFAGAAGYSCMYFDRAVKLFDANPKIVAVWDYLISAAAGDIAGLPDIMPGESLNDYSTLTTAERALIGFCINPASSMPKITASKRSAWIRHKAKLVDFVPKIKHWSVALRSWDSLPNEVATWHIDPPYQKAGKYYFGYNKISFDDLGDWCASRQGQVMVCENAGADWLPFRPLVKQKGMTKEQVEVIWTNDPDESFTRVAATPVSFAPDVTLADLLS